MNRIQSLPRSSRRRLFAVLISIAAIVAVAVPVAAHNYEGYGYSYSAPSGCTAGRLCVYSATNFSGSFAQFAGDNNSWNCCSSAKNNDDSAYNNGTTGNTVKVFASPNLSSTLTYCLRKGHGIKFIASTIATNHANNGESNDWQWLGC